MPYYVFISHSSTDKWVAKQIEHYCRKAGAQTFLDDMNIPIGGNIEAKIWEALDKATELLVLGSPWALKRPWVWIEIGKARQRKIPIILVLHGLSANDFRSQLDFPVFLSEYKMIDLNRIDDYFQELRARGRVAFPISSTTAAPPTIL